MDSKKEPGSNAPPPLANRNQIHPGTGVMSEQPGTSTAESLDMWQTMNRGPVSRQHQELSQGSLKVPSALPGGPSGATIPQMPGPLIGNSNPVSGSVGPNGPGGPTGTLQTVMYSNAQPEQVTSQNPMLYQQHQLVMHQKLQQQQQQQQEHQQLQSLLLPGKIQMGGMQQNRMNSGQQQPVGQGGSFHQLTLMSQQQQQPQAAMQNPSIPAQRINNVTGLQQQQLQMQQNQQQSRMPQNQILNQHVMLGQQQSQMMGSGGGNMNFMQMQIQKQLQLLQQQHQQQWQPPRFQLPLQQQLLAQQQQQIMMQQMEMQQQPMHRSSAPLQAQNVIAIDPQRQQQQQLIIPQQQQSQRQQRGIADGAYSSASMESTAQTRNPRDWQEEIHQKLTHLKDTYLADLQEVHQKLSTKLSQPGSVALANARGGDQVEKMKQFKIVLERMMAVLQLSKQGMSIGLKDKLALFEKQILSILRNHKKVPQQYPPPRKSQPRKCEVCIDCVHKRRNS